MEGPVQIAVTSRSLFDGGAETLHFSGAGTLRPIGLKETVRILPSILQ